MRLALLAAACPCALALPWSRIACMEDLSLIPRTKERADSWRYLDKVVAAGGYEHLVRTYRRVLTAPRGCLTRYLRQRFGRDAPHDVAVHVLEYWKPPGGP